MNDRWFEQPGATAAGAEVCAGDAVGEGEARSFALGRGRRPFELIVARSGAAVCGYVNICPHNWIPLNIREPYVRVAERKLQCDHHFAAFRVSDGVCDEGVCAGDAPMPVPLEERDGRIYISARTDAQEQK